MSILSVIKSYIARAEQESHIERALLEKKVPQRKGYIEIHDEPQKCICDVVDPGEPDASIGCSVEGEPIRPYRKRQYSESISHLKRVERDGVVELTCIKQSYTEITSADDREDVRYSGSCSIYLNRRTDHR